MPLPRTNSVVNSDRVALAAVFVLLVAIGTIGRWGQPEWCVTPLAAVALLAGYTLPLGWAVATPLLAMALSDLALAPYDSWAVPLTVYAAFAAPALLGRVLRQPTTSAARGATRLIVVALVPAVLFFLSTNFAVWASQSLYPKTPAGLAECYTAAIPFFRRMLAGDLAWTAVVFGAAAAAGVFRLRGAATADPQLANATPAPADAR